MAPILAPNKSIDVLNSLSRSLRWLWRSVPRRSILPCLIRLIWIWLRRMFFRFRLRISRSMMWRSTLSLFTFRQKLSCVLMRPSRLSMSKYILTRQLVLLTYRKSRPKEILSWFRSINWLISKLWDPSLSTRSTNLFVSEESL